MYLKLIGIGTKRKGFQVKSVPDASDNEMILAEIEDEANYLKTKQEIEALRLKIMYERAKREKLSGN